MSQAVSSEPLISHSENSNEIARLKFALSLTGAGIWDIDATTRTIYCDARCQELFGAKNLRNPGIEIVSTIIHPDDLAVVKETLASLLQFASKEPCDITFRTIGYNDQVIRYLLCRGQAYFDANNNPTRFSGILTDISAEHENERLNASVEDEVATLQSDIIPNTLSKTEYPDKNFETRLLAESETRFRLLIENAPMATCLFVGPEFMIDTANQIMLDLWGKGSDVIGKTLISAIPELSDQPFISILENVFASGTTYSATGINTKLERDGKSEELYFDFTYNPLKDSSGKSYAILGMAVDVTKQVHARKQLEESELFTRSVFDNSPIAKLVFVGSDMIIKSINQNMLAMLGRDESIKGMPFFEAMPELAGTDLPVILHNVFTTGVTHHGPESEYEVNHYEGPYKGYYDSIYKALKNPEGEIYGIMVTTSDISNQVAARKKIIEAEESLRQAVELAQLGTWSYELESGMMLYGTRMRTWFGFNETEPITIRDAYERVFIDDQEKVATALRQSLDPQLRADYDVEYRIRDSRSGDERILRSQGKAFFNEKDIPYRVSGTAQEITAQRKVQAALEQEVEERTIELKKLNVELITINEELNISNERLVHSNEELAQYAYVASHDLQEPLRKIRLFSDLLHTQMIEKGDENYLVNKIIRSAERMTMLIRDLLEFSRLLKSDRLMRPVSLGIVAEAVVNDFELSISEKKAEITIGQLPVIEAVNLQMNQLFYNLLGNALKFSNPGIAPVISIASRQISQEEAGKHLGKTLPFTTYHLITFSDNGIGFAPEYKEQIFEVFKRLHGRDMYPGSGIGLALCRRIVANHQGHLYAESTFESGTIFHIILPEKQQNVQSSLPANFTWPEN